MQRMRLASWLALSLIGCAATPPAPAPAAPAAPQAPSARPPAPAAPAPVAGSTPLPSATPVAPTYRDCGDGCKAFPTTEAAFDFVLAERPRVLAIGEAHAQSGGPGGASSTKRFMDQLLPRLAPRASDLVIELWLANGSCGKVEQKVQKQQQAVTAPQAATNQNEFVELGHRAKAAGIMPHALVPSCEQYQKISSAGPNDVAEMLAMIKTVTQHDVETLLAQRGPDRLVVAYGGAMHNDLVPREGRQDFSFGPELKATTSDRYVELDLVIPEQIKDTEAWRSLPWYGHYSAENAGNEALLYSWAPHAYALFFPKAKASVTP
jgi:hypothetical protein